MRDGVHQARRGVQAAQRQFQAGDTGVDWQAAWCRPREMEPAPSTCKAQQHNKSAGLYEQSSAKQDWVASF